ncbi:MAG TPA: hypothetical protein PK264_23175, partial [Hyphomicrobiaceae bacterium]|nr:hypothetical protein [Hyphomicrobiaceae bacterium]
ATRTIGIEPIHGTAIGLIRAVASVEPIVPVAAVTAISPIPAIETVVPVLAIVSVEAGLAITEAAVPTIVMALPAMIIARATTVVAARAVVGAWLLTAAGPVVAPPLRSAWSVGLAAEARGGRLRLTDRHIGHPEARVHRRGVIIARVVVIMIERLTRQSRPHAVAVRAVAMLRRLLLAHREDDSVVVLGVLQIVLSEHRIAGTQRIARERHVLFGNQGRGAADLDVRAVAFEIPGERIVALAVVVVPTAATPVLLSLPHGLSSSLHG